MPAGNAENTNPQILPNTLLSWDQGPPLSSNLKSPTAKPNCAIATQTLALYLILVALLGWNQTDHMNCQLPRDTCHHLQNAK